MTLEHVREQIERMKALRHDPEAQSVIKDELYCEALQWIARGEYDDVGDGPSNGELAASVLEAETIPLKWSARG